MNPMIPSGRVVQVRPMSTDQRSSDDTPTGSRRAHAGRRVDGRPIARRSFLASTAAATAGAVVASPSAASAAVPEAGGAAVASQAVVVTAVRPDGSIVLRRRDGTTVEITDPQRREQWHEGDEAVVELVAVGQQWRVQDLTRLYRPILAERITGRRGNLLQTASGTPIEIVPTTVSRPDAARQYVSIRLDRIGAGDVVSGLSYLDPATGGRVAAQLGVLRR
jgi:hypothetical protein